MAKRDPEGRQRTIVEAALELLAEAGLSRLTHRAIAARAEVPLGSTTYYFPTLKDLVRTCLDVVVERNQVQLENWSTQIADCEDLAETVAALVGHYLEDRQRAAMEYEIYLAAARDEELRIPAAVWVPGLSAILRRRLGPDEAEAAAMLIDGAILQALATGQPPRLAVLRRGVARLAQASSETSVGPGNRGE